MLILIEGALPYGTGGGVIFLQLSVNFMLIHRILLWCAFFAFGC